MVFDFRARGEEVAGEWEGLLCRLHLKTEGRRQGGRLDSSSSVHRLRSPGPPLVKTALYSASPPSPSGKLNITITTSAAHAHKQQSRRRRFPFFHPPKAKKKSPKKARIKMVRLTVRVSEVDQFSVDMPAATTTAGQATRALARLHNLRVSIAQLRAEGVAMAARWRQGERQEGGESGTENDDTSAPLLLKALTDAEAAAFDRSSEQPLTPAALRSHLARVRAAADGALGATAAAAADAPSSPSSNDAAQGFLLALEAAEGDARSEDDGEDGALGDQGEGSHHRRRDRPTAGAAFLDPRLAAAWFCGRPLQPPEATLARLLGGGCATKADRTRAVLRLSRDLAAGCPARPGALMEGSSGGGGGGGNGNGGGNAAAADERRAMLAWCYKRQQELARLDEAAREGDDDHCDAPWADPRALRRDLMGLGAGGVRWC